MSKGINWGGLCKGLLAGAAIVAGVALVCPGLATGVIDSVVKMGVGSGLTSVLEGAKTLLTATGSDWMSGIVGWAVKTTAGVTMAVIGTKYLTSDKEDVQEERHAYQREARESFAMREDMRKMQAVMVARMQASGHQPAMAMQR